MARKRDDAKAESAALRSASSYQQARPARNSMNLSFHKAHGPALRHVCFTSGCSQPQRGTPSSCGGPSACRCCSPNSQGRQTTHKAGTQSLGQASDRSGRAWGRAWFLHAAPAPGRPQAQQQNVARRTACLAGTRGLGREPSRAGGAWGCAAPGCAARPVAGRGPSPALSQARQKAARRLRRSCGAACVLPPSALPRARRARSAAAPLPAGPAALTRRRRWHGRRRARPPGRLHHVLARQLPYRAAA